MNKLLIILYKRVNNFYLQTIAQSIGIFSQSQQDYSDSLLLNSNHLDVNALQNLIELRLNRNSSSCDLCGHPGV